VTYLGKDVQNGEKLVKPHVIIKNDIKLGIYAVSFVKEERLNHLINTKELIFLDDSTIDHKILILH